MKPSGSSDMTADKTKTFLEFFAGIGLVHLGLQINFIRNINRDAPALPTTEHRVKSVNIERATRRCGLFVLKRTFHNTKTSAAMIKLVFLNSHLQMTLYTIRRPVQPVCPVQAMRRYKFDLRQILLTNNRVFAKPKNQTAIKPFVRQRTAETVRFRFCKHIFG